jgi:hypothetical protein
MHTREGEGGAGGKPHLPPQKTLKSLVIKTQKNPAKIGDSLDFLTAPSTLLKRI